MGGAREPNGARAKLPTSTSGRDSYRGNGIQNTPAGCKPKSWTGRKIGARLMARAGAFGYMGLHRADWAGPGTGFTVLGAVAYVDTIALYCWKPLPGDLLSQLRRQYGHRLLLKRLQYGWMVEINQPTLQTLCQLAPFEHALLCLSRVDIAFDPLTQTKAEGVNAANFLKQHTIQKWRRNQESVTIETTTYWSANRKTKRNIVAYGDKRSKITSTPCAHLELRFTSAAAVKRAKLDLKALIAGIDVPKLLQHQTKLAVIDPIKLKTRMMRFALNTQIKKPNLTLDEINQKIHHLLLRATGAESIDQISSQAMWKVRGFRDCLRIIPWIDLIPELQWYVADDATPN